MILLDYIKKNKAIFEKSTLLATICAILFIFFLINYANLSEFSRYYDASLNLDTRILLFLNCDLQYLPLISNISKYSITEFQTYEILNTKLLGFPLISSVPVSIFISIFEKNGWIYFKGFYKCIYFIIFFFISYKITKEKLLSLLISLSFYLKLPFLDLKIPLFFHKYFVLPGSTGYQIGERIPRPFITDLYGWLLVLLFAYLISLKVKENSRYIFFILGITLGACLQGGIYIFITFLVTLLLLVSFKIISISLKQICLTLAAFLISIIPFIAQHYSTAPDVLIRLGLEEIPRIFFLQRLLNLNQIASIFLIIFLIILKKIKGDSFNSYIFFSLILFLTSQLALNIFGLVSGKMIQGYQFRDASFYFFSIFNLVLLVTMSKYILKNLNLNTLKNACIFMLTIYLLTSFTKTVFKNINTKNINYWHLRSDFELYKSLGPNYQKDFSSLTSYLEVHDSLKKTILLTHDHQLASWWLAFKGKQLYLPDVFLSTLKQSEVESRFAFHCEILGLKEKACIELLTFSDPANPSIGMNNAISNFFFGHAYYHTNEKHHIGNLAGYSFRQQEQIQSISLENSWHLLIAEKEQDRLINKFRENFYSFKLPDKIILFNSGRLANIEGIFQHSKYFSKYKKIYTNNTFVVFSKIDK